ncbi:hypothetical protein LCGC14_0511300 [marine sediment metagenome]|uniref:Uncharacterized protein n=1 Tax=marine sediment metagenome TaxID=412755 RepID=A0A0F9S603_9ZZZZ
MSEAKTPEPKTEPRAKAEPEVPAHDHRTPEHGHSEYVAGLRALLDVIEGNPVDTAQAERVRKARAIIGDD